MTRTALFLGLVALFASSASGGARAQDVDPAQPLSVPAEFVRYISPPGVLDHFERPSALFVDRAHDELLIADPGKNRIVIFDTAGSYKFEFSLGEHAAMPLDLAVDSQGFILVVGSTKDGRKLLSFDFDGVYTGDVVLPEDEGEAAFRIDNVGIASNDRLVLLDRGDRSIRIYSRDGHLLESFPLMPDTSAKEQQDAVLGKLSVIGDRIYVPFSSLGTVRVYSADGEHIGSFGTLGSNPGELAFPVAVTRLGELVLILDKHRFNVACFAGDGHFLGEFGGKGISPGWFYFPSLLGAGRDGQVIVGQIYRNRIQICQIPAFIRAAGGLGSQIDETNWRG